MADDLWKAADVIYTYSRKQAIEDGVLGDVTAEAVEAGFNCPVAVTSALWDIIEDIPPRFDRIQDVKGRLWDVLFMAQVAIQCSRQSGDQIEFSLNRVPRDGKSSNAKPVTLKLIVGPGDHGEPVITILQLHED